MEIVTTLIGAFALGLWVYSIQCKERSKFLKIQIFANIVYALEYLLLGAYSAVVMNLSSTIRSKVYYDNKTKNKDNNLFQLIIFIVIIVLATIITDENYLTILVMTIAILYTYASWQKSEVITRYIFTFGAIAFMYYNASVGAYFFVVGNLIELVSGIIAIVRFDLKVKRKEKSKEKIIINK